MLTAFSFCKSWTSLILPSFFCTAKKADLYGDCDLSYKPLFFLFEKSDNILLRLGSHANHLILPRHMGNEGYLIRRDVSRVEASFFFFSQASAASCLTKMFANRSFSVSVRKVSCE